MLPSKKVKPNEELPMAKSVLVNFMNNKNESLGVYDISVTDGPPQFQQLLNTLLPEKEDFNFFYRTKEIKNKLQIFFHQIKHTDYQATLNVVYHPTSMFKVRPITRASSSMYGHTEAVLSLQFSPDSLHLASGSGDATVRLWDIHTQTPMQEIIADNWVMIVSWAPDAEKFAYAEKNGNVTVYNIESNSSMKLNGHSKWVTSLAWMPLHLSKNCNRLVSASKDCTLRLHNTESGVTERSFGNHTKCVTQVVWTGANEIISGSEDQRITVYDSEGNYLRDMKKHAHWVNSMSLSTGNLLKRGCFEPGKPFDAKVTKHQRAVELYSKAEKQRLVTGSDDFTLMLFQLPQKKPLRQMTGHGKPVNHVQFSPDARYIASASFDKRIKLWDGYTGEFMYTFDGHVGPVYLMVWSVDGRYIVSASQDSTLKLWDIKTRKLMMDLPGHADQIYALDWDANGRLVASGGKDQQVKLWTN